MRLYTIQNDLGDRGWIQIVNIVTSFVEDELCSDYYFDIAWKDNFCIITKQEYDILLNLNHLMNESGLQEHGDILMKMIDITIEKNKENTLAETLGY